jgi:hypothetical protein
MTAMYGERSAQLDELFKAMSVFQGDIDNVIRTRQGEFGLYADLGSCWDSVRKFLKANGLCLIAVPVPYGQDGTLAISSILGHSSGQFVASTIPLTAGVSLQDLAGDATYARRIAMGALLGLAADWDDDGKQSKANHHKFVSDSDKKWFDKAKKALSEADGDAVRIAGIYELCDDGIRKGHMSQGSKDLLLETFPMPKEEAVNA